jgi:hypothetical protein
MTPAFAHTPHIKKQTIEPIITSLATDIVLGINYRFVKPQNGPTFHEHVEKGLHVVMARHCPHSSIHPHHPSIHTHDRVLLSHLNAWPYA